MFLFSPIIIYLCSILAYKEDKRYKISKDIIPYIILYTLMMLAIFTFGSFNLIRQFLLLLITAPMVLSAYIDDKVREIPDAMNRVSSVFALIYLGMNVYAGGVNLTFALSAFLFWFVIFIVAFVSDGVGFGDIKMLIPVLLCLSANNGLLWFMLAYALSSIATAIIMAIKKQHMFPMAKIFLISLLISLIIPSII